MKISNKAIDVYKIDNGVLGVINLNNMIPTPSSCLIEALPHIQDYKYRNLLIKQVTFLNEHKKELLSKAKQFQLRYSKGHLPNNIIERCCDFQLLEDQCKKWELEKTGSNIKEEIGG